MADVSAMVAGLETNLQTISGLRVIDKFEGNVPVPAAVVDVPEVIDFDEVFGRGHDRWEIPVVLLVSMASERAGRTKLYEYLNSSGSTSIKTAIEDDPTLGGAADTTRVIRAENIGHYIVSGIDYLGATFICEVIAAGV